MKVLQGHPVNLAFPIIGRVSRNGGQLCLGKDTIFVSEQIRRNLWGYAGIVVGKSMNEVQFHGWKTLCVWIVHYRFVFLAGR